MPPYTKINMISLFRLTTSAKQDGLISKLDDKKSVLYSRLSDFYVGIRRFIFKFLVLYSRSSYNKGRLVFQRKLLELV